MRHHKVMSLPRTPHIDQNMSTKPLIPKCMKQHQ